jgi:hypothetical protein
MPKANSPSLRHAVTPFYPELLHRLFRWAGQPFLVLHHGLLRNAKEQPKLSLRHLSPFLSYVFGQIVFRNYRHFQMLNKYLFWVKNIIYFERHGEATMISNYWVEVENRKEQRALRSYFISGEMLDKAINGLELKLPGWELRATSL